MLQNVRWWNRLVCGIEDAVGIPGLGLGQTELFAMEYS